MYTKAKSSAPATQTRIRNEQSLMVAFNGTHLRIADQTGVPLTNPLFLMAHIPACKVCPVAYDAFARVPAEVLSLSSNQFPHLQIALYDVGKKTQLRVEARLAQITTNPDKEYGINEVPVFLFFNQGICTGVYTVPREMLTQTQALTNHMARFVINQLVQPSNPEKLVSAHPSENNQVCLLTMDEAYDQTNTALFGRR